MIEAASTDEAQIVLDDAATALDAVLCHAEAPGTVNPFALRRHARALDPRAGVQFVLTGRIESTAQAAAELCQDGPQLARPYDPQAVVAHIRRLLAARDRPDSAG